MPAYGLLFFAAGMLLLSSCSIEKKLGKEFRENWSDSLVLVLVPDYIFKNNLKTYEIAGLDSLPEFQQDSILVVNSLFLKQISDSITLAAFTEQFISQLKKYQLRVLKEKSLDSFMVVGSSNLLVNIAQISMEEFVHPYSFDYNLIDESLTVNDIDLNAISFNVWIELSRLNSNQKNKVLFTSDFITDDIKGYFRQFVFTDQIQFEYTLDTLSLEQIDTFTVKMGQKCAYYLYDYFLNGYIKDHIPPGYPFEVKTLHWDPDRKVFDFVNPDDQFIELENPGQ